MNKEYLDTHQLTIQQLSERLDIPKPTIRFWEKELEGIIVPLRTPGGQRRYTNTHIAVLEKIKDLRNSGKSISDIKNYFKYGNNNENLTSDETAIDILTERIAELVKMEVSKFFKIK